MKLLETTASFFFCLTVICPKHMPSVHPGEKKHTVAREMLGKLLSKGKQVIKWDIMGYFDYRS